MDVILDTNILLGALISPSGNADRIYMGWRQARYQVVTSAQQLEELRRASRYPKLRRLISPHRIGTMVNNLRNAIVLEKLPVVPDHLRANDSFDDFLVAMALASKADYLVTGDHKAGILKHGHIGRTRLMVPAKFCKEVLGHH